MENTKTVLKNEIHIAGTVVSMRMEERGNCILVIRSNAERQIRNIQLRFYDINQAIIFRVGDHVRIAGHSSIFRTSHSDINRKCYSWVFTDDDVVYWRFSSSWRDWISTETIISV